MAKARRPGDPWHTVLYREPYRLWWAPALFVVAALLTFRRLRYDESWLASWFFAAVVAATYLLVTGLRRRSRHGESVGDEPA